MKIPSTLNKKAKYLALISFLFGTFLLVVYYLTMSTEFALLSYLLITIIGIINLVVLAILLIKLSNKNSIKKDIFKTIGIMLLNIPVALIYFYIVAILTNYIRITITNKTNTTLSNLIISGCEEKKLDKLNVNENETVWIKIPNDCTINLTYKMNGMTKNENIFGYVTTMMGQEMKYEIGINKKPLDTEF